MRKSRKGHNGKSHIITYLRNFVDFFRGREVLLLLFFYLLNIVFRFLVLFELSSFPNFYCHLPLSDADFYYFLANLININSPLVTEEVYYYSPLYSHFLSLVVSVSGENHVIPRIINIILGSTVPIGVFLIAREVFSRANYLPKWLPYISLILASFYDLFVFYDNQVLKTSFGIALITWGLFFLIKAVFNLDNKIHPLISGFFFGLSALIYANILLPLGLMAIYLLFYKRFKAAFILVLPIALILGLTAYRNYTVSKDFVLITAVDGIHFYIGNKNNARGSYTTIDGIRRGGFGHYFDARKIAEKELKRDLKPSEVSGFWKSKGYKWIKENPLNASKLFGKKILRLLNHFDMPNNEDKNFIKKKTSFFKYLTFPFWFVAIPGLSGMILSLKDRRFDILSIFIIGYGASIILYFITDRYRLPLVMPLSVYSSCFLYYAFKDMRSKIFAAIIFIGVSLVVFIDLKIPEEGFEKMAQMKMDMAVKVCLPKEELQTATDGWERSVIYTKIASNHIKFADFERAKYYLKEALRENPENADARSLYDQLTSLGIKDPY